MASRPFELITRTPSYKTSQTENDNLNKCTMHTSREPVHKNNTRSTQNRNKMYTNVYTKSQQNSTNTNHNTPKQTKNLTNKKTHAKISYGNFQTDDSSLAKSVKNG